MVTADACWPSRPADADRPAGDQQPTTWLAETSPRAPLRRSAVAWRSPVDWPGVVDLRVRGQPRRPSLRRVGPLDRAGGAGRRRRPGGSNPPAQQPGERARSAWRTVRAALAELEAPQRRGWIWLPLESTGWIAFADGRPADRGLARVHRLPRLGEARVHASCRAAPGPATRHGPTAGPSRRVHSRPSTTTVASRRHRRPRPNAEATNGYRTPWRCGGHRICYGTGAHRTEMAHVPSGVAGRPAAPLPDPRPIGAKPFLAHVTPWSRTSVR